MEVSGKLHVPAAILLGKKHVLERILLTVSVITP
jgi:hypothetical protein